MGVGHGERGVKQRGGQIRRIETNEGRGDKERKVTKKDGWGVLHALPKSHPMESGGGGSRNGFHGDSWFLVAWHVGY